MPNDSFARTTGAYRQMEQAQVELPSGVLDDRDSLKDYQLGVVGYSVYAAVKEAMTGKSADEDEPRSAAAKALDDADTPEEASPEMIRWRDAVAQAAMLPLVEMHYEFGKPEYERLLREIVQGALTAAKELRTPIQPVIRVLLVLLLNLCPHQGRLAAVKYLVKTLAYEITISKLSLGIAMKLSAYAIGEAIFMMAMQDAMLGRKDGAFFNPQPILVAAMEGSWAACELISPNSPVHVQDNGDYVVRGFSDSEKRLRKAMITGTVDRVLNLPVIGWVYRPMRWMVRVAYHKLKQNPLAQKLWNRLME